MRATVEAIFEDGVFTPVQRPEIPECEHVEITIEMAAPVGRSDPLELAKSVYHGWRPEEVDETERIALDP